MSLAVCLSLVANLRCSGLKPQQAIGILVPPAVEALLISFLIYTQWNKGRKHFLLLFDSYIFLLLCVADFVSKANDAISMSIPIFSVVDRVIGGLSGFPIVFYTLFLYLFARRHFILILPPRIQWGVKVLLTVLIPVILVLVELGSLLGYTYITLSPSSSEIAVRYNTSLSKTLWTLLSSAGLVLLVLYQFVNFCLAVYRIFRYFHHAKNSDGPAWRSHGGKDSEKSTRLRGVGWIAAGIKLGAIEVLFGFIPNGFGMALSRRLFRLVGRLMLAWGVYQGIDESPGTTMFRVASLDSIEGLPPRRIPVNPTALRNLIGAPIGDTFAKMSPTATAFHTRKKVPDAMVGVKAVDMAFVNEKSGSSGGLSKPLKVLASGPTSSLRVQNVTIPARNSYGFGRASVIAERSPTTQNGYPARPTFPKLKQAEKRVTIAYDGRQAPVLDIRFSSQVFPDAGKFIGRLGKHSSSGSTDLSFGGSARPALSRSQTAPAPAVTPRARSMPPAKVGLAQDKEPSFPPAAPATATAPNKQSPIAEAGGSKDLLPMSRTANGGIRGRSRSASNKSVPTLYNPFADPPNLSHSSSQETTSSVSGRKRKDSSLSEDSLTAIHQLSMKFPPLPPGASQMSTANSPTRVLSRKRVPDEMPNPSAKQQLPARRRSNSSPRLQPEVRVRVDSDESVSPRRAARQDLSPRTSLDQDVAIRTRRRIPAHLKHISSATSLNGPGESQGAASSLRSGQNSTYWSSGSPNATTVTSGATSLFSTPVLTKHNVHHKSISRGKADLADDMLTSPITVFSRDSTYSNDDMLASPLVTERPMGRIARRALGIEQFLGEEKEKWEASQDGHGDTKQSAGLSPPMPKPRSNDPSSQLVPTPASRVRPRSNMDAILVKPPVPIRSMTVDDPGAREAFAAAWRTVVPNISSPSVADLKTVNSVSVKRTPAPSRHRAVFSGASMQSMKVDEGHIGLMSPGFTAAKRSSRRGDEGNATQRSKDAPESDREFIRKARLMKVASVDSEVY